mmetsp:Transcript_4518/g.7413  ORF Transcript_4518/g.7413 Transcript_4518/m.7413 type:complete len:241 (-) Transcript_4518:487-1209(-)
MSSRLNSVQFNSLILHEWIECSNGIGSTSHTGNNNVRKLSSLLEHLCLHLSSHNRLEVSDNCWEGVGSYSRSNKIVSITDVGYPISHCFVNRILQCGLSLLHGHNLGSQSIHTEYIQLLTLTIDGTHVYGTVQSKLGANRRGGYTMLPSTSLGDNTGLTNLLRQKGLTNGIVDFVCSSVSQILPLQPNGGSATHLGKTIRPVKRSGSSHKVTSVYIQLSQERRVVLNLLIFLLDLSERLR